MKETFNEISSLARQMLEETKIASSRALARRLYDRLCVPETRHKLAKEAPSFKALQSVWELIISNTIKTAERIDSKSKQGLSLDDISITFQLIQLSDKRYSDEAQQ